MSPRGATLNHTPSIAEQQEIMSRSMPLAGTLDNRTEIVRTPDGREIPVGFIPQASVNRVPGRPFDVGYANALLSMLNRHEATGIMPAAILNYLPIPLVVNSPMQDLKVRIPAAPLSGDGFSFHVWYSAAIEVDDMGEGVRRPVDFQPIQLAKAFEDEYKDYGGVVLLRGIPDEETLSRPKVEQMIADAKEKMIKWMLRKVEEANGEWNTVNRSGARNIVELHRQCAQRLFDLGIIDALPEWMVASRALKDVAKRCPACQTQPNPGATECLACHFILDPEAAYINNVIKEDDESLERLTRKQVEALGISAFVAETIDEKPERVRTGLPKPLSKAQMNAIEIQQQLQSGEQPSAL